MFNHGEHGVHGEKTKDKKSHFLGLYPLNFPVCPVVKLLFKFQNRKYLCAMGSTAAGSHTSSSPSARTA